MKRQMTTALYLRNACRVIPGLLLTFPLGFGASRAFVQETQPSVSRGVPGWYINSRTEDTSRPGYVRGIDTTLHHGGNASAMIRAVDPISPGEFGEFTQTVRSDNYKGKRVRLSGWIKTKDADRAGLWMRIDGKDQMLGFDNMLQDRPVIGTHDWTQVSVVLDVPTEALGFCCGALLVGEGQIWVDDLSLEVVDPKKVDATMPIMNQKTGTSSGPGRPYQFASATPINLNFEK